MTYSKSHSGATHEFSKNKPSLHPQPTFNAQFVKILSITEDELKKCVAYKKSAYSDFRRYFVLSRLYFYFKVTSYISFVGFIYCIIGNDKNCLIRLNEK